MQDLLAKMAKKYGAAPRVIPSAREEIRQWRNEPAIGFEGDVQQYMAANAQRFPIVAVMWRRYLSAPASACPCERLNSAAGNLYTKKRARLSDSTAMRMLLVHDNLEAAEKVLRVLLRTAPLRAAELVHQANNS
jgi:hypothetical protein